MAFDQDRPATLATMRLNRPKALAMAERLLLDPCVSGATRERLRLSSDRIRRLMLRDEAAMGKEQEQVYQHPARVWNDIAREQTLATDFARRVFPMDPERQYAELEALDKQLQRQGVGSPGVRAAYLKLAPLLWEKEAIAGHVANHPTLRNGLPNVEDAGEAVLIASLDHSLDDSEKQQLLDLLQAPPPQFPGAAAIDVAATLQDPSTGPAPMRPASIDFGRDELVEQSSFEKPGVIYIMQNPGLREGLLKIGRSTRSGHVRARELNSDAKTGTPGIYKCVFQQATLDCVEAELRTFHQLRAYRRGKPGQEFFEIDLATARGAIVGVCHDLDSELSGLNDGHGLAMSGTSASVGERKLSERVRWYPNLLALFAAALIGGAIARSVAPATDPTSREPVYQTVTGEHAAAGPWKKKRRVGLPVNVTPPITAIDCGPDPLPPIVDLTKIDPRCISETPPNTPLRDR